MEEGRKRKVRLRHERGLCRCGRKAEKGVKMCARCLLAARVRSRQAYRIKAGIPLDAPLAKGGRRPARLPVLRGGSPHLTKGVTRQTCCDGYGRESSWYVAAMVFNGKPHARRWSVSKYGEDGARLAASLQKLLWLVESGTWNPADGDVLSILSYAQTFEGNRDYQDCEVVDVSSPWIQEYEEAG